MPIPMSHSAQPLFLFDYRGYTNTLQSHRASAVRQRLFTGFTKYGLCVVNDIPLQKESTPFLSPQLTAWVDCSASTCRPFSCMCTTGQKEGENPAIAVRTGGDSCAKPPGENNTGDGKKAVLSPQGTRDRSDTCASRPAEQRCSLSLPCSAGATHTSGGAAGREAPPGPCSGDRERTAFPAAGIGSAHAAPGAGRALAVGAALPPPLYK